LRTVASLSRLRMSKSPFDIFDAGPPAAPLPADQPEPPRAVAGEAHAKLKRNLDLALERHEEILSQPIREETDVRNKRLVAEVATATVKAALTTDRTALKARQDKTLEILFLRVLFVAKSMGKELSARDLEKLKTAPRAELEAALSPRFLAEYDRMEF
jgi:hypothetical protein